MIHGVFSWYILYEPVLYIYLDTGLLLYAVRVIKYFPYRMGKNIMELPYMLV